MIIGNGDIASVLTDDEDKLFFVSGVSSGSEERQSEFERERILLMQQDKSRHIVYCSSLCVFNSNTPYASHKRMMEWYVKTYFEKYTIIRLGNITFGNNPKTLINFLRNKIKSGEPYEVRDVYRYLVDKDEFLYWVSMIPDWSCEMNVTGKRMKVRDIVEQIKNE